MFNVEGTMTLRFGESTNDYRMRKIAIATFSHILVRLQNSRPSAILLAGSSSLYCKFTIQEVGRKDFMSFSVSLPAGRFSSR